MRKVIELKSKIKDREFFLQQFHLDGNKRMLFVNPMLSGKALYKSILPAHKLMDIDGVVTAITNLADFDVKEQLVGYKSIDIMNDPNSAEMIRWSTHIVFPFVLQPLSEIYQHIRELSPYCKILYNVDFNFYELPNRHPLKSMFDEDFVIPLIEDNMYFADTILVENGAFQQYLINKFSDVVQTKYVGVYRQSVNEEIKVHLVPIFMDEKFVLDNVDYEPKNIIFKVPVPEEKKPILAPENSTEKIKKTKPATTPNSNVSTGKKKRENKPKIVISKVVKKVAKKKGKKK